MRRERMTNPSVKLDRRLTLMLPEVPIPLGFFSMLITRASSFDYLVRERNQAVISEPLLPNVRPRATGTVRCDRLTE